MKTLLLILFSLVSLTSFGQESTATIPTYSSAEEVITAIYTKNNKCLYKYMVFDQHTIFYENDMFKKKEIWKEVIGLPGRLVVKMDGFDSGRGMIFQNDSMFVYDSFKLKKASYKIHDLVWLGFDLMFINPEVSIPLTAELGYDVTQMYESNEMGRDVYIIGVSSAEDNSNQFWIDKERLTLVKQIKFDAEGVKSEVEFDSFVKMGSLWISTKLIFKKNNILFLEERYNNINLLAKFDDSIFKPKNFAKSKW